jgi:hypothetical protein
MINILQNFALEKGLIVNQTEIEQWYNSLDTPSIESSIRSRIQVQEWDGMSPINGVNADDIKNNPDFPKDPDAKGYFVYIDNNLVYFQYHTLNGKLPITDSNWQEESSNHVNQIVQQMLQQEITNRFLQQFADRTQANILTQQNLDLMAALADIAIKIGVIQ